MKCVICRATEQVQPIEKYVRQGIDYQLYECPECRIQFWYPNDIADQRLYDDLCATRFTRHLPPLAAHRPPQRIFFKQYAEQLRGATHLDIGCGDGGVMYTSKQCGARVWGVDYNSIAIKRAREKFGFTTVANMKLEQYLVDPPRSAFDVITAFEVIEHVQDPISVMRSAHALLEPGGLFAFSVPPKDRLRINAADWDYPPHHLTRWSDEAITRALRSIGFDSIKFIYSDRFWTVLYYLSVRYLRMGAFWGVARIRYRAFSSKTFGEKLFRGVVRCVSPLALLMPLMVGGLPALLLTGYSVATKKSKMQLLVTARSSGSRIRIQ